MGAARSSIASQDQVIYDYIRPTARAVQPCELYGSKKAPQQQLFAAAAAMFAMTGDAKYRRDADGFFQQGAFLFNNNWDNTWAQGVTILATTARADPANTARSQGTYRAAMKASVKDWTDCSINGAKGEFCKCAAALCYLTALLPFGTSWNVMRVID